ncbi:DUF7345 domain-containing protein [Natrinema salifodinae]
MERPDTWQVIRIGITDTGDAEWTIESRFLVTNETEAEVFDEYATEVASGTRDSSLNPSLFARYASLASESTDREMTIENAGWDDGRIESLETDRQASIEGEAESDVRVGVISYSFTWTNFATVDGDRIRVSDGLQTDNGPLISTLTEGQRFVIEPPANYAFVDSPTGTENGALVWEGPHEFSEEGLEITIVRSANERPLFSRSGWLLVGFIGLTILVGIGSYLLARRHDDGLPIPSDRVPADAAESLGLSQWFGRGSTQDGPEPAPAAGNDGGESITDAGVPSSTSEGPGSRPASGTELEFEEDIDDAIDPELLSDEERVLRLLRRNNGRMKQASIVKETGWSNAKVSQLLSQMDEDGEIEKLRIGRENLITLPEVDPTALD